MKISTCRKVLIEWNLGKDTIKNTVGWMRFWKLRNTKVDLIDCLDYGNMSHLDLYMILYKITDIISDNDYSQFAQMLFDYQHRNGSRYVNDVEEKRLRRAIQVNHSRRALQSYLFSVCGNEYIQDFAAELFECIKFTKDYGKPHKDFI